MKKIAFSVQAKPCTITSSSNSIIFSGSDYGHATITFWHNTFDDKYEQIGDIEYQQNKGEDEWYGGTIKCSTTHIEEVLEFTKVIKRIQKEAESVGSSFWRGFAPEHTSFLAWLRENFTEAVYDGRVDRLLPLDEVPGPEYSRWMAKASDGSCILDCMARDEEEARRLMVKKAGQRIAQGSYRLMDLTEWLQQQDVEQDTGYWARVPDARTAEDKLGWTKEEEEREQTAFEVA